jgi:uncharacterized protein (DUF1778 family)
MSQQNFPRREKLDEHLHVVIATDDKRRIYEAAAARRLTVSEFVRAAIVRAASEPQAA